MRFSYDSAASARMPPQASSRPSSRLPILRRAATGAGAALSALLLWACIADPDAALRLAGVLGTIHSGLVAVGLAGMLSVALNLAALPVAGAFGLVEILQGLAAAGAMIAALPFAQAADPDAGKPAGKGGGLARAQSEMQVGAYIGGSITPRSNVRLVAPDDTDITLKRIKWKTESLEPAIYYGARGIDWNSRFPNFGGMADFTHAKATAIRSQRVKQEGRRKGETVPPEEPFESTFRKLEFTHGLNFVTLNGLYRFTRLHRRIVPYVGVGVGFMIPHAEAWRAGLPKDERAIGAQVTGLAYQVFGGAEWRIFVSDDYAAMSEYRVTYASNDVKLREGGNVYADLWVHQFNVGVYYYAWRAASGRR